VVDSIYRDEEKIGSDKKSVSFSFILSNTEWTINDEEALSVQNLIIHNMKEKGYNLRGF
jgi:phenylalanyl-tRNA synthetase beta subunit